MPSKSTLKIIEAMLKTTNHSHQESTDKINYILYKLHKSDKNNQILNTKIDKISSRVKTNKININDVRAEPNESNNKLNTIIPQDISFDNKSAIPKHSCDDIKSQMICEIEKYDNKLKKLKHDICSRKIKNIIEDIEYISIEFGWRVKDYFRIIDGIEMEIFSKSYYSIMLTGDIIYIGVDLKGADNTNLFLRINDATCTNSQLLCYYDR